MSLKGTDLTSADAAMLSWWLSIPSALRVLIAIGSFLSIGWTARGVVGQAAGMDTRVGAVEDSARVLRTEFISIREQMTADRRRFEQAQMYMMCLLANPGLEACNYIVRDYPEFINATRPPRGRPPRRAFE